MIAIILAIWAVGAIGMAIGLWLSFPANEFWSRRGVIATASMSVAWFVVLPACFARSLIASARK